MFNGVFDMKASPENRPSKGILLEYKPKLSAEEEQRLFQATGRRVAAVVQMLQPERFESYPDRCGRYAGLRCICES